MTRDIKGRYRAYYGPLWEMFLKDIADVNVENCPEPHFPIYGEGYAKTDYKIAFIGIDTRGSCGMANYRTKNGLFEIINDWKEGEGFDEFAFCEWERKGSVFWKFVFQFLANFYDMDLDKLKEATNEESQKILKSFIWGNVNSIERFHVTAKGKGVRFDEWEKVKKASIVFDKLENILKVFSPNIIILLNWNAQDEWFTESLSEPEKFDPAPLWYCFDPVAKTHLFWTKHPRSLLISGFDEVIYMILQSIKEKNIFQSFPGERFLRKYEQKYATLEQLQGRIEILANELSLQASYEDANYARFGKQSSGFWFYKKGWKYCIYFFFEDDFDSLLIGIDHKDNSDKCSKELEDRIRVEFRNFVIDKKIKGYTNWMWVERFTPWSNTSWDDVLDITPNDIKEWCKKILSKLSDLGLD